MLIRLLNLDVASAGFQFDHSLGLRADYCVQGTNNIGRAGFPGAKSIDDPSCLGAGVQYDGRIAWQKHADDATMTGTFNSECVVLPPTVKNVQTAGLNAEIEVGKTILQRSLRRLLTRAGLP
jgi:hypothetical protein